MSTNTVSTAVLSTLEAIATAGGDVTAQVAVAKAELPTHLAKNEVGIFRSKPSSKARARWDGRMLTRYEVRTEDGKKEWGYHTESRRLCRRDFLTLKPEYVQRAKRKGKFTNIKKHWNANPNPSLQKTKVRDEVATAQAIIDANAESVRMAAIKGMAVSNPLAAQHAAWAARAERDSERVGGRRPFCGYTTPKEGWMPPVYNNESLDLSFLDGVFDIVEVDEDGNEVGVYTVGLRGIVSSVPHVRTEADVAAAAYKADRAVYKAERRAINSAAFTLAAVLRLTARRTGAARVRAGGLGITPARIEVLDTILAVVVPALAASTSIRARRRVRKPVNNNKINQNLARIARKKRQSRNAVARKSPKTAAQRLAQQQRLAAKQQRRAERRAELARLAAARKPITRAQRYLSYVSAVERPVTVAQKSERARAANRVLSLASGAEPPKVGKFLEAEQVRARLEQEQEELFLDIVARRHAAPQILNRSESEDLIPAEFVQQAAERIAAAKVEYREELGLEMVYRPAASKGALAKTESKKEETEQPKRLGWKKEPNEPRFAAVTEDWNKVLSNKRVKLYSTRLKKLTEAYNARGYNAKDTTVEGVLANAVAHGLVEWTTVVSEDIVRAVYAELAAGKGYKDLASTLGKEVTTLQIKVAMYLIYDGVLGLQAPPEPEATTKPKQEKTKMPTSKSVKSIDIVVKRPFRVTADLEAMGLTHAFTLAQKGAAPYSENDAVFVCLSRVSSTTDVCNNNYHLGILPDEEDDKYEDYAELAYARDNKTADGGVNKLIPTSAFLGFDYKAEDKAGWTASPAGAQGARMRCLEYTRKGTESVSFRDAAWTNVDNVYFTRVISHCLRFGSQVNEQDDTLLKKDKWQGVADLAARVRTALRDAVYAGNERHRQSLANHGNLITIRTPLKELMDGDAGIIDPRTGEALGQHYLLFIARVADYRDELRPDGDGHMNTGQYRVVADYVDCYFVPTDVLEELVDVTAASYDNNFFTFIEKCDVDQGKAQPKSKVRRAAAAVKPAPTPAPTPTEEEGQEPEQEQEEEKPPVVTPDAVEVTNTLQSFREELEALYYAYTHPLAGKVSDKAFSADDIIDAFTSLEPEDSMPYYHMLLPHAKERVLDEIASGKKFNTAEVACNAVWTYLYGHISNGGTEPVAVPASLPLHGYDFTIDHIKDIFRILAEVFGNKQSKKSKHGRVKARRFSELMYITEIEGGHALVIDGVIAFTFDNEGMVYDWRGRAFSHVLVMEQVLGLKKKKSTEVHLMTSMSSFVNFVWLVLLPIISNWRGSLLNTTFDNIKVALQGLSNIFPMTTDRVKNQNGAAQHALVNVFSPQVIESRSPLAATTANADWQNYEGKVGRKIVDRYKGNAFDEDCEDFGGVEEMMPTINSLIEDAQRSAHEKYGIDFHYAKGQFVSGFIGHINVDMVAQYAPELFKRLCAMYGSKLAAYYVIAATLKAEKGLKRVTLAMAQAARLKDESLAAWELYGMANPCAGWKVSTAYFPTIVGAPGIAVFIGAQEEKPVAIVPKVFSVDRKKFDLEKDAPHPFNFLRSNIAGVVEMQWTPSEGKDGWNTLTPESPIPVKGTRKEVICEITGGQPLLHQYAIQGELTEIKWRISTAMNNVDEVLEVQYCVLRSEFDPKLRQCNKDQMYSAIPDVLFNGLNPHLDMNAIETRLLHFQDGMKMDTIYSWLFILANTVFYNYGSTHPAHKVLDKLVRELNVSLKGHENLVGGKPVLVIESTAVAAGLYNKMLKVFEETFGAATWMWWLEAPTQARVVYDLYCERVGGKDGWRVVDKYLDVLPELASIADRGTLWVISQDEDISEKTNILAFVLDENGNAIEYAQRGYGFISVPGFDIYNVELFEASTVKDSVTESVQMMGYIKALSTVGGNAPEVCEQQYAMLKGGEEGIYRAKYLAAASCGSTLNPRLKEITITADAVEGLLFTNTEENVEAIAIVEDNLRAAGIDVDNIDLDRDDLFPILCQACRDVVFTFVEAEGKVSMWLPALYNFTKLSIKSDEHRDFVAAFIYEVLLPCIENVKNDGSEISLNRVGGILRSYATSRRTTQFMGGGKCVGAKRIGLPNIPVGEVWILVSDDTNSVYQQCIRTGIPVDDRALVAKGLMVSSNRAPMPMGPICRVRLLRERWETVEVDGKKVEQYVGQVLIPFEGEEPSDKLLAYELSPVHTGLDVMSVNIDGGDYDGDQSFLAYLHLLALKHMTTYEQVRDLRSAAIGVDMFDRTCGGYAADHYGIKTYKAATVTLNDLATAVRKAAKPAREYVMYNVEAYNIQMKAVGVMYGVYMFGEIVLGLIQDMKTLKLDTLIPEGFECLYDLEEEDRYALVLVIAEIYEIMLGGYGKHAFRLWDEFLKPVMEGRELLSKEQLGGLEVEAFNQKVPFDQLFIDQHIVNKLKNILEGMGANTDYVVEVLFLIELMREYYSITKAEKDFENVVSIQSAIALVVFEMGRGKFGGFNTALRGLTNGGHYIAYQMSRDFITTLRNTDGGRKLCEVNLSLRALCSVIDILGAEIVASDPSTIVWEDKDLNYFLKGLRTPAEPGESLIANAFYVDEEDEDDNDDTPDDDGNDDGGNDDNDPTPPAPEPVEDMMPDVVDEDGMYIHYEFAHVEGIRDELFNATVAAYEEGEISRFSKGKYGYTCAGDYYWVWNKGKGKYLETQPSGSDVVPMPAIIKSTAEAVVDSLGLFEGYEAQVCLINKYEGKQSLNLHVDKDEECDAPIVSLSFGAMGTFKFDGQDYAIGDGDLFVFYGSKRYAVHGYLGNDDGKGVRYNVTVRMVRVRPEEEQQQSDVEVIDISNGVPPAVPVWRDGGILFHSKSKEYREFSNFAELPVTIDGITFRTAEGAYQSYKMENDDAALIAKFAAANGSEAKALGAKVTLREDWDEVKLDVMYDVLLAKFSVEPLRSLLLETDNETLLHYAPWEVKNGKPAYWGVGKDNRGYNWMGVKLMEVRAALWKQAITEYEAEQEELPPAAEPQSAPVEPEPAPTEPEVEMDYPNVVISGSRSITELPDEALDKIDEFIARGASFNVGDAPGVDLLVQTYLKECGVEDVRVWWATGNGKRKCIVGTPKPVNGNYTDRDAAMHRGCDESLVVWDGVSPGSKKNIKRVKNTTVIRTDLLAKPEPAVAPEVIERNDNVALKAIEDLLATETSEIVREALKAAYDKMVTVTAPAAVTQPTASTESSKGGSLDEAPEGNVPEEEEKDYAPPSAPCDDDEFDSLPLASTFSREEQDEEQDNDEEDDDTDGGDYTPPSAPDNDDGGGYPLSAPCDEDEFDSLPLATLFGKGEEPPTEQQEPTEPEPAPTKKQKKVLPSVSKLRKQEKAKELEKAKQQQQREQELAILRPRLKAKRMEELKEIITTRYPKAKWEECQAKFETLSARQLRVPLGILKGEHITLTGVGGGGKSYTVETLRDVCNTIKFPHVDVGSTGTSVMNIQGHGTLNSVFGLGLGFKKSDKGDISSYEDYNNLITACRGSRFVTLAKKMPNKHRILIIVDEVSMVDNRLLHVIQDAIKEENLNVQWLLVGDPMQFLPVRGSLFFEPFELRDSSGAVVHKGASFLERIAFNKVNLTQNLRADGDKEWVDALNDLRLDRVAFDSKNGEVFKRRFQHCVDNGLPEDAIHLFFNNAGVKMHNRRGTEKMVAEGAEFRTYKAYIDGHYPDWYIRKQDDGINKEEVTIFDPIGVEMTFCIGMPVMIRTNIYDRNKVLLAANGSIGRVVKLGQTSISIKLDINDKVVCVDMMELPAPEDKNGNPIGTFRQIPAHPCFAMTFHKSQGLTLRKNIVVHFYSLMNGKVLPISPKFRNSVYVPPSRVPSSQYFHIATSTEFNPNLTPKRMWELLCESYHTDDKALAWIESIEDVE